MIIIFYVALVTNFTFKEKIKIPELYRAPIITSNDQGKIWIGGYFSSRVSCFNHEFKEIYEINYGSGEGPGEFKNPIAIIPIGSKLLVVCKFGKTLSFYEPNGTFLGNIIRFNPFAGCLKYDENSFIVLWGKNSESFGINSFSVFDLKGNVIDSWEVKQPKWREFLSFETPRGFAISPQKEVFVAVGGRTNLLVFKHKSVNSVNWPLKPPTGFVSAPKKDISPSQMYNPESVNNFMNSFTTIYKIFVLEDKYLIVSWKNLEPIGWTMDAYDINTRKEIALNQPIAGPVVGVVGKDIYIHEYIDSEEEEFLLHRFVLE